MVHDDAGIDGAEGESVGAGDEMDGKVAEGLASYKIILYIRHWSYNCYFQENDHCYH